MSKKYLEYMGYIERIYQTLDQLDKTPIERDVPLVWEKMHAVSCAHMGRLLALRNGMDPELAAIACLLHDIGRWYSGRQENHAAQGEVPVRGFLEETELSTDAKEQIVKAVINHSDKQNIGTDLEEIVKDADILDCYCYGLEFTSSFHAARLDRLLKDLSAKLQR